MDNRLMRQPKHQQMATPAARSIKVISGSPQVVAFFDGSALSTNLRKATQEMLMLIEEKVSKLTQKAPQKRLRVHFKKKTEEDPH
jgi:hypothetical protein